MLVWAMSSGRVTGMTLAGLDLFSLLPSFLFLNFFGLSSLFCVMEVNKVDGI